MESTGSNANVTADYMRTNKALALKRWQSTELKREIPLSCWRGEKAIILPLRKDDKLLFGRGGVLDAEFRYIQLSAIDKRIECGYQVSKYQYNNEKVVYCGYFIPHWGHFLVEVISRLWYFLKNDNTIDKYVFFVDEGVECAIGGNFKEFFYLLGVWDKIEIINKPTQYKEVIIPELSYKRRVYYTDEFKSIFSRVIHNIKYESCWQSSEKIFLSRSKLKNIQKHEIGSEMLDNYFNNNGYSIVYPERISLSELIFILRNAKVCASVSGSVSHNMLFDCDNKKWIIVERNVLNNEIQVDINNIKATNVIYIDANIPIYPTNIGYGPIIFAYNKQMQKFTEAYRYLKPEKKYLSKRYIRHCFSRYMATYKKEYHYQWFMLDWYSQFIDIIIEGYQDGQNYIGEYLNGSAPFRLYQYISPHYIKQNIKKIVKLLMRL